MYGCYTWLVMFKRCDAGTEGSGLRPCCERSVSLMVNVIGFY